MTELYSDHNAPYAARDGPLPSHPYPINNDIPYPAHGSNHVLPPPSTSSNTPSSPESNSPVQTTPKTELAASPTSQQRQEGKQQATFLTKLYALLEREDNHHMIRWDPQGEHIIVEKPEQLAIHVLPSVYRQSRFASFSRQLNIYGFMRKVNLRNVDPAIDDPDASTWSHPTLNRHSPADVVANFKRRVPPRIPKSKKRAEEAAAAAQAPRPNVGLAPMAPMGGRARSFTTPGSFTPLSQGGAVGWGTSYPRSSIPPLDVPGQPHHMPQGAMFGGHHAPYGHSSHHQLSPADDQPPFNSMPPYQNSGRDLMLPSQQYPYQEQSNWSFGSLGPGPNSQSHSGGSLSSLLNPSSGGGGGYARPSLNTYGSSFASMPPQGNHSPSSPTDSRPNTGYSVSSVTSVGGGYDDVKPGHPFAHEYSRPVSSHHRQLSPGPGSRPGSSHNPNFQGGSLSVRRTRRHSQAQSPYPSPYDQGGEGRPSTSPPSAVDDQHHMSRVRGMAPLGGEAAYAFNAGHGDFAYSAGGLPGAPGPGGVDSMDVYSRSVRPSTSASSMSTASHASSQAVTPPANGDFGSGGGETDISRFSPDFGYVAMDQHHHVPQYAKTAVAEL